jgi:hypothetical protein
MTPTRVLTMCGQVLVPGCFGPRPSWDKAGVFVPGVARGLKKAELFRFINGPLLGQISVRT